MIESRARRPEAAERTATIAGHVTDTRTHDGVAGMYVDLGGDCAGFGDFAITDEHGYYEAAVAPGACETTIDLGDKLIVRKTAVAHAAQTTAVELELDHDKLVAHRDLTPPLPCPHSAPDAVVVGHTTQQADVDGIARAVLDRFVRSRASLPDGGLIPKGTVRVRVDITGRLHRALGPGALPAGFVAKTDAELRAEADATRRKIHYIWFGTLDSDGACAIVNVGVDYVKPSANSRAKLCCCDAVDVYEKRKQRWRFVTRVSTQCA